MKSESPHVEMRDTDCPTSGVCVWSCADKADCLSFIIVFCVRRNQVFDLTTSVSLAMTLPLSIWQPQHLGVEELCTIRSLSYIIIGRRQTSSREFATHKRSPLATANISLKVVRRRSCRTL